VPDAAVLSSMAKQLEEALKRPAATVVPPPAPAFLADEDDDRDEDDLLEGARRDEDAPTPFSDEEKDDLVEEPIPAPRPEPPRAPVEPIRPAPSPLPPQQREPAPASDKDGDPFSVEEIEAEFARLLGRPLDSSKKG
jgi:flagellar protein FliO/FliZ